MSDRVSDGEITNWGIRHDINRSLSELRAMFEDAASFRYDPDKHTEVLTRRLKIVFNALTGEGCSQCEATECNGLIYLGSDGCFDRLLAYLKGQSNA